MHLLDFNISLSIDKKEIFYFKELNQNLKERTFPHYESLSQGETKVGPNFKMVRSESYFGFGWSRKLL